MSSGYRSTNQRRDSPSSSSRPRSNSKTSDSAVHSRNRNNVNGKMPSAAHPDQISDGMAGLALENLKYPVGSKVTAKFKNGSVARGEVVAYDPIIKVVILKSSGSRPGHNNVSLVNILHCSDIKVDEEGHEPPRELQPLNINKLEHRLKDNSEKKRKLIMAFKVGISPEGQKLFQTINKTIDDITWNGDNIVVMKDIYIEPPYRPENIKAKGEGKGLVYIKQITEKFISDEEAAKAKPATVASPPPAPEATPTTATTSSRPPSNATSPNPNSSNSATPPQHGPPKGSSGPRGGQNRNNPGRNANRQHHEHHAKTMYNN